MEGMKLGKGGEEAGAVGLGEGLGLQPAGKDGAGVGKKLFVFVWRGGLAGCDGGAGSEDADDFKGEAFGGFARLAVEVCPGLVKGELDPCREGGGWGLVLP